MRVILIATFLPDQESVKETLVDLLGKRKINGTGSLVFLAQENINIAPENRTMLCAEFHSSNEADGFIAEFEASAFESSTDVVFETLDLQERPEPDATPVLF